MQKCFSLNFHDRLERIRHLLLQNKTPTDKRGKSRSGNAKPEEISVRIHNHISKFEVKETHYSGKPKKYLDARLTLDILSAGHR